jgi:GxxExxY protein
LSKTYQPDLLVEDRLVVELKALDRIGAVEEAQLLNYLKATDFKVGLIINFGATSLEWKRMVF